MQIFLNPILGLLCLLPVVAYGNYITIGNPGNPGSIHSAHGAGTVGYEYRIGKYEVTAGEYTAFLNIVAASDPNELYTSLMDTHVEGCQITQSGNEGSYSYGFEGGSIEAPGSTATDWQNRPVNFVSWYDAARYTNWLTTGDTETGVYALTGVTEVSSIMDHATASLIYGTAYFIPTPDEWYKAACYDAGSGTYYRYPTSSNTRPGYVTNDGNLSGGGVFVETGSDPGNYATHDGDGNLDGIGSPFYRTNVGEWENSPSPYGTYDQGGNVVEWTETEGFESQMLGVSYGGVMTGTYPGFLFPKEFEGPYYGFRVASLTSVVPEPSSLWLLLFAILRISNRKTTSTTRPSLFN